MFPLPIISKTNKIVQSNIQKMTANQDVIYLLFKSGNLYVMGSNQYGTYGNGRALTGAGNANAISTWSLSATGVKDIWTGSGCSVLLLNNGTYQYCGLNRILGTVSDVSTITTTWSNFTALNSFITSHSNLTVKKIHMGGQALGILMSDDNLYFIGYNSQGQLGTGSTSNQSSVVLSRNNVSDFILGTILTLCIDKSTGIMYKAGWNQSGQLGTGDGSSRTTWTSQGTAVTALWATASATMFVDSTGNLWGSGEYTAGQLNNNINLVTNSTSNLRTTYLNITAGLPTSTSLLGNTTSDSTTQAFQWYKVNTDVYVIGQNLSGQMSTGSTGNISTFTKMILPSGYNAYAVQNYVQVGLVAGTANTGAGGDGSAAGFMLTNDGKMWCCGDYRYFSAVTGLNTNQTQWVQLPLPAGG